MRLRLDGKLARQEEAAERLKEYEQLSVDGRIALLDSRLGKGVGAKKQRARLESMKEDSNG